VFRVTVNNTNPMVFYCSQDYLQYKHCQSGMVGVVNSDNATLTKYKTAARNITKAMTPAKVFGGDVAANPNTNANFTLLPDPTASGDASGTASTTKPTSSATSTGNGSPSTAGGGKLAAPFGVGLGGLLMAIVVA
jgi:hypothetical protein